MESSTTDPELMELSQGHQRIAVPDSPENLVDAPLTMTEYSIPMWSCDFPQGQCNSRKLLRTVVESLKSNNYAIGNIDATIICETPKLQTYITQMTANISDDCNCDLNDINIKATTTEKLGFIGRSEGIGAQAICLIRAL